MKYIKWKFVIVPDLDKLKGKNAIIQTLYLWMCKFSNEEGCCFPSMQTLADCCWIKKISVLRYIKKMEEIWLIRKENRFKDNEKISNIYYLEIEGGSICEIPGSICEIPGGSIWKIHRTKSTLLTKPTELRKQYLSKDKYNKVIVLEEVEKFLNYWNKTFLEKRKITDDLEKKYLDIRKKVSKEDFIRWFNLYMTAKLKIKEQEWEFKYLLSPIAFLTNVKNWIISYL